MLTRKDKQEIRKIFRQELREYFKSEDEELNEKLDMPIQELEFSVRTCNVLELGNIHTVRQLVRMKETELLKIKSCGRTCLSEIRRNLAYIGLTIDMDV